MAPAATQASNAPQQEDGALEFCPVCRTRRYLNVKMRFMIEPKCYHKMCENCVRNRFSEGPAACPIAGCGKTLRKQNFRFPTFGDLAIEREVDIRARVARILNRREDDFETLRDFNDYEEKKEEIIWNLVKRVDEEQTEAELGAYKAENEAAIHRNRQLEQADAAAVRDAEVDRLSRSAMAREEALKEVEIEKADRAASRKGIVDRLQQARLGDTSATASAAAHAARKPSSLRRPAGPREAPTAAATKGPGARLAPAAATAGAGGSFGFRGLKKEASPAGPEAPYDPFAGLVIQTQYYTLQDAYDDQVSDRMRKDVRIMAGGYDPREYYARAQVDAHAGLGVFIGEEMRRREVKEV